jgi:hypothetical protein
VANLPPLVASSSCVEIPFLRSSLNTGLRGIARELLPAEFMMEDMVDSKKMNRTTAHDSDIFFIRVEEVENAMSGEACEETRIAAIHAC